MTQSKNALVLKHLQTGRPLTSWEAILLFHHTRLAAYIEVLKKQGYEIETELIPKGRTRYAVYRLKQTQNAF